MARPNTLWSEIRLAAVSCGGAALVCALMLRTVLSTAETMLMMLFYGVLPFGLFPITIALTVATGRQLLQAARQRPDSFFYRYSSTPWVLLLTVLTTLLVASAHRLEDWYPVVAYLHAVFLAVWGYCMLAKWRGV
ncbi:hypothetical protein EJV47_08360 [Hymenobacter gummosus]|uniref:Uncharacterized protein n=1 Tax=Hymenobacter gummosus TaxID=1776032 RepID=A0A3S0H622_9BACT|nr:hypothetical protein [Hymenobacter gummosus]RTQ50638.1 hypothetical protein EJV47_08360 [Hymenobacter gummosus]